MKFLFLASMLFTSNPTHVCIYMEDNSQVCYWPPSNDATNDEAEEESDFVILPSKGLDA